MLRQTIPFKDHVITINRTQKDKVYTNSMNPTKWGHVSTLTT